MGAALKLEYTYRYAHPSQMTKAGPELGLRLATFGGAGTEAAEHPFFFDGRMRQPHVVANMLLTLAKVVSTRFWMPLNPALLDPVVTSNEELLRFEGFSSCCGVYARADLEAPTFDADIQGRGTTNVDFNSAERPPHRQTCQPPWRERKPRDPHPLAPFVPQGSALTASAAHHLSRTWRAVTSRW